MTERTIRIALCDVRHVTAGLHSPFVPLPIGLVGAYAREKVTGARVDLRLYWSAEKFLDEFDDWRPDIFGCSLYCWNRNLALFLLSRIKESLPRTLTVVGGPEIEMAPGQRRRFLETNPQVDLCVVGEGEETFREIVERHLADGLGGLGEAIDGAFFLRPDGTLAEGPLRPRLASLDEIPSPYLLGLFDDFFEDHLHPFVETTRGCPFTCTFCHYSLKMHNKARFLSRQRLAADLEYCAKRFQGRHDVLLCLADANFGMYAHDLEAAEEIRRVQETYDWPRYLDVRAGKNKKERIVQTSAILKWGMQLTMSAQSMNPRTLEDIQRKNISTDLMREAIAEAKGENEDSYVELIFNLPLETRRSFEDGIRKCIELDINRINITTLALLKGTPIATCESRRKYGFQVRHRIIPRDFGRYRGKTIVETEEVVVATDTMSLEDHLYLREFQFTIQVVFNCDHLNPVRRFLSENGGDIWDWLQGVYRHAKTSEDMVGRHMKMYAEEARDELFASPQAIFRFAADDDNYAKLLSGHRGGNLMDKYTVIANGEGFRAWLDAAVDACRRLLAEKGVEDNYLDSALNEITRFIIMKYDFSKYLYTPPRANRKSRISFDYNIERWLSEPGLTLAECRQKTEYDLWFTEEKVKHIHDAMENVRNKSLEIQFIYRSKKFHAFMPEIELVRAGQ